MSEEKEIIHISTTLEGETRKKAIEIKTSLGVKRWADMMRYLITHYHKENIQDEPR